MKVKMEEGRYLVVFLSEASGDIEIRSMTKSEIKGFSNAMRHGFAIVAGWLIKDFDEKLNMARL